MESTQSGIANSTSAGDAEVKSLLERGDVALQDGRLASAIGLYEHAECVHHQGDKIIEGKRVEAARQLRNRQIQTGLVVLVGLIAVGLGMGFGLHRYL